MIQSAKPQTGRPRKVIWLIENRPPPTPLCFDSTAEWQSYLTSLADSGEPITRKSDTGKWTTRNGVRIRLKRTVALVWERIDYCQDCAIGSHDQMAKRQAGRCILPPLPYTRQIALFDAATDTLTVQRDRVAEESARKKTDSRIEKAAAYLREHGFDVRAPSVLSWLGISLGSKS